MFRGSSRNPKLLAKRLKFWVFFAMITLMILMIYTAYYSRSPKPGYVDFHVIGYESVQDLRLNGEPMQRDPFEPKYESDDPIAFYSNRQVRPGLNLLSWTEGTDRYEVELDIAPPTSDWRRLIVGIEPLSRRGGANNPSSNLVLTYRSQPVTIAVSRKNGEVIHAISWEEYFRLADEAEADEQE